MKYTFSKEIYKPMKLFDVQRAIKLIKQTFQTKLSKSLKLKICRGGILLPFSCIITCPIFRNTRKSSKTAEHSGGVRAFKTAFPVIPL